MVEVIGVLKELFGSASPAAQALIMAALIGVVMFLFWLQYGHSIRTKRLMNDLEICSGELGRCKADKESLETERQQLLNSSESVHQSEGAARRELAELRLAHSNTEEKLVSIHRRVKSLDSNSWMTSFKPFGDLQFVPRHARRARFVVVQNLKGGVGKTATVSNIAAAYATGVTGENLRVLVVDLDFQGSLSNCCVSSHDLDTKRDGELTSSCLIEDEPTSVSQLVCPMPGTNGNAHVIIADESLLGVDFKQQASSVVVDEEVRLKHLSLFHESSVHDNYDLVIFDCPPRMTTSTINALIASDWLLIPTTLDPNDVDAVPRALQWLTNFRDAGLVATQLAGVLINRVFYSNTGITGKLKNAESAQLSLLGNYLLDSGYVDTSILPSFVSKNADIANFAGEDRPFATTNGGREHYKKICLDLYDRIK